MTTLLHAPAKPIVRALTPGECDALLRGNTVGRLAFAHRDRVDVEPMHFVYDPPWIFGRTSTGAKLLTLSHNQWCALETDTVHGLFDWASVVVKGPFSPAGSPFASWKYERALAALRTLVPETLTPDDPAPHRDILFGLATTEIIGRCSESPLAA